MMTTTTTDVSVHALFSRRDSAFPFHLPDRAPHGRRTARRNADTSDSCILMPLRFEVKKSRG
jgi:hypothetical protein